MKLDFVIGALKACARAPPPRVVAFADVDIVAHRPFAAAMRAYLRGRDLVFQADNGFKVVGNLGLMAMRCNARVLRLWEVTREAVLQPSALALPAGGDQKLLNKLLYAPLSSGARYVRWGVLPWPELTTSTNEVTLGKHRLTGDGYLHHANDGGHKDAAKGFEMKVLALRVWLERANQTGRCRCELRMPAG